MDLQAQHNVSKHPQAPYRSADSELTFQYYYENQNYLSPESLKMLNSSKAFERHVVVFTRKWEPLELLRSVPIKARPLFIIDFPVKLLAEDKNYTTSEILELKLKLRLLGYENFDSPYLRSMNEKIFKSISPEAFNLQSKYTSLDQSKSVIFQFFILISKYFEKEQLQSLYFTYIHSLYFTYIHNSYFKHKKNLSHNYYDKLHNIVFKPYFFIKFQYKKRILGEVKPDNSNL